MIYLIVGEDESYQKNDVNPEELKAAARGEVKIFEIDPQGVDAAIINVYDPIGDHFETELPKRWE